MPSFFSNAEAQNYLASQYKSNTWQTQRQQYYSFIKYPEAGQSELQFFGTSLASNTARQLTNLPKANSFGQKHFLLKSIGTLVLIQNWKLDLGGVADADSLMHDFISGFFNTGYFELNIGSKSYIQQPKPFLCMPPLNSCLSYDSAGLNGLTLNEATPNTLATAVLQNASCRRARSTENVFITDPNILIEAEQSFEAKVTFPRGSVPVMGTNVTDDSTNPLYVGVIFDGIEFRPVQ